jgi:voltage-gated potassium channel Kch
MHNLIFVLLRRLHLPLILLICVYAVSIIGFVLIPGVDDEGNPWRMDFFHAFYFVSYMGTTIGFGELPYSFTDGQRMWTLFTIYSTVIAWLYGISALLTTLQDPGIRKQITTSSFLRSILRINEPFYIVCGYGDTGSMLVTAFNEVGIKAVVVEIEQTRIDELELADFDMVMPGLCADASEPDNLIRAGLKNKHCIGVVGLTNNDTVNLKISITTKLLNPGIRIFSRAESRDVAANILSFGTDYVINPFDVFSDRLSMALHSPGFYLLDEWMTSVPHEDLTEPLFPPRGKWLLCGYGRFGKAVYSGLVQEDMEITIIEANPDVTGAPSDVIVGRGTEAETLLEAGIENAVGIVAGTDDDANNLSIILTAKQLNPKIFLVARQNLSSNDVIFQTAGLDLVMRRGSVTAHTIFAIIRTPLLKTFLEKARENDNEWANRLVSRISGVVGYEAPVIWGVTITKDLNPGIYNCLQQMLDVTINNLYQDPRNRDKKLECIPLLHYRGGYSSVLPDDEKEVADGDQILFCGHPDARNIMQRHLQNENVFKYILTGEEHASSYFGKLLTRT